MFATFPAKFAWICPQRFAAKKTYTKKRGSYFHCTDQTNGLKFSDGFATDILGFLLIFPVTRKFVFEKFAKKFATKKNEKNNFIDGDFEDIEDENDKKL